MTTRDTESSSSCASCLQSRQDVEQARQDIEKACAAECSNLLYEIENNPNHPATADLRQRAEQAETALTEARRARDEASHEELELVKAHWFIQGGEAQFGSVRETQNADDLIAEILSLVRATADRQGAAIQAVIDEWREIGQKRIVTFEDLKRRQDAGEKVNQAYGGMLLKDADRYIACADDLSTLLAQKGDKAP